MSSIEERMLAALSDDDSTDSQKDSFISALSDNCRHCAQQANRSFLLFLGFCGAFTLIVGAQIDTVKIFGIDFSRNNAAILLLPSLASFFLYRASCLNQFHSMIKKALEQYYESTAKSFSKHGLTSLLAFPSIGEVELALAVLPEERRKSDIISLIWFSIIALFVAVGPSVWLAGIVYWLLSAAAFHLTWKIATSIVIFFFVARAYFVVVQTWRYLWRHLA